jgi:glycosyltransferase involved in cell wall biosynthesis
MARVLPQVNRGKPKLLFFVTEDWYFCSHRLPLAVAARAAGFDVGVITRINQHAELIQAHQLRLIPIELSRKGINPWQELRLIGRLYRIYRQERPDIVHQVTIKPVLYGTLAAKLSGVGGIVNALAGLGFLFSSQRPQARLLRPLISLALRLLLRGRGNRMIVQNPEDKDLLTSLSDLHPQHLHLIRGAGVDLDLFTPQPEPAGTPVVILASRLLWDKGVGVFAEAAHLLQQRSVQARLVLVGKPDPGNPAAVDEEQIRAWTEQGLIEWWGHREDMAQTLAASHIVCLPSSYGEGIPKVLLEAAASGRPIVATQIAGCREIVEHGKNGLLVPQQDPAALADALQQLIDDAQRRRLFGDYGRRKAVREFGLAGVIRETLSVYQSVLPP